MDPLTAGITYSAMSGGAGGGAAAMANPIAAAIAAIAAGTAYGVSPSVRRKVNPWVKKGYEGITNPFQHFGDGTEKDKFGSFGSMMGMDGTLDPNSPRGKFLSPLLNNMPQRTTQQGQQQKPQNQGRSQDPRMPGLGGGYGGGAGAMPAPIPVGIYRPFAPESTAKEFNPLGPMFQQPQQRRTFY